MIAPPRVVHRVDDALTRDEPWPRNEWEIGGWFQSATGGKHDGDDNPITITVRQALKISAIIDAARSNEIYRDALNDVSLVPHLRLSSVIEPNGACPAAFDTAAPAGSGCVRFRYDANDVEIQRKLPGNAAIATAIDKSGRPTKIVGTDSAGTPRGDIGYNYISGGPTVASFSSAPPPVRRASPLAL